MKKEHLITPLAKVRGLGSAHDGTMHWWWQRVTAIALIPLSLWFVNRIMSVLYQGDTKAAAEWFASPVAALLMLLLVPTMAYHGRLGMQVIIEDYVHSKTPKFALLILNKLFFVGLAVIAALSIIKLHLGSAA